MFGSAEDLTRLHESLGKSWEELSRDFTSLATLRALAIRRSKILRVSPSTNHPRTNDGVILSHAHAYPVYIHMPRKTRL